MFENNKMPAGRPAIPKAATKFLNSKRRVIYMTANGKYIAKAAKGTVYNPKARFVKSPGGTERSLLEKLKRDFAVVRHAKPANGLARLPNPQTQSVW